MLSGIVAIVGRPNVGKSSLLNALVGRKISIVAPKPQTTRHRIQGVLHRPQGQVVFVDTPGLHRKAPRALNRYMNDAVSGALSDVDLALFVVEAGRWTDEDEAVLEKLKQGRAPVGLVVNKVDKLDNKAGLLPELEKLSAMHSYAFIVPLSAKSGDNLDALVRELFSRMPEGPPLYPEGQIAGHDLRFTVSELVREKLMRALAQELPYALTVETETLDHSGTIIRTSAVIWVERDNQKKIVIGEDGAMLKRIGSAARRELEYMTGAKVVLKLWVKVKENWTDDPQALKRFGYLDN
ncbi:GTPase Era [Nevskia soli]|uniref:GTPase Era n=1 Tax=Nevskia soli TaxID=418856 RepID=UPI0004A733F6|nr:GTPase Era [Nevskia soli]